jgi:hypothetical protein
LLLSVGLEAGTVREMEGECCSFVLRWWESRWEAALTKRADDMRRSAVERFFYGHHTVRAMFAHAYHRTQNLVSLFILGKEALTNKVDFNT